MRLVQYLEVSLNEPGLLEPAEQALRSTLDQLQIRATLLDARLLRSQTEPVLLLELTWAAVASNSIPGWPLALDGAKCRSWVFEVLEGR